MRALCEWGIAGAAALAEAADVFIVVDVLSFTTCVDIACANAGIGPQVPQGSAQKILRGESLTRRRSAL